MNYFDGTTGPYAQYTYARAKILREACGLLGMECPEEM